MKEVLEFLANARVFYLATMDGDQPRVRPLGFVMEYDGKLAFSTNNQKKMYQQMISNPKVEICAVDDKMNTLRICGEAFFVTSDESQKKALEVSPFLGNMYAVGDGKFELFSIKDATAALYAMGGETRELSL